MILDCDEIIPSRLWIGRYVDPSDIKLLGALGITTLVSLQSDQDLAYYGISIARILRACEEARIDFRRIAIPDFDRVALAQNLPSGRERCWKARSLPARGECICTAAPASIAVRPRPRLISFDPEVIRRARRAII